MGKYSSGFTLIEIIVTLAIIAITTVLAVPSFNDFYTQYQLKSTAQDISDKLKLAQSESKKRRINVYFSFQTGSSWCYGLNDNSTCNCNVSNNCLLNSSSAVSRSTTSSISGITLTNSGSATSTYFDKLRGTTSSALALTLTKNSKTINININNMGEITIQ